MPMLAYPGSTPTSTVPSAMVMMVKVNAALRPCVSPKRGDDDAAERAHQKTDAEPPERCERYAAAVGTGKEGVADRRGKEHGDAEIVPLQNVADRRGEHRHTDRMQFRYRLSRRRRRRTDGPLCPACRMCANRSGVQKIRLLE